MTRSKGGHMAAVIQNWGLKAGVHNPWTTPPELVPYYLVGVVDGQQVEARVLRRIEQVFECEGGMSFELGEVHPGYNIHCGGNAKALMLHKFNPPR